MSDETEVLNSTAQGKLKSFVERIERLNADKDEISQDIAEVYLELKGDGFDPVIVRKIISMRKLDPAKRQEIEALIDLYLSSIGSL